MANTIQHHMMLNAQWTTLFQQQWQHCVRLDTCRSTCIGFTLSAFHLNLAAPPASYSSWLRSRSCSRWQRLSSSPLKSSGCLTSFFAHNKNKNNRYSEIIKNSSLYITCFTSHKLFHSAMTLFVTKVKAVFYVIKLEQSLRVIIVVSNGVTALTSSYWKIHTTV